MVAVLGIALALVGTAAIGVSGLAFARHGGNSGDNEGQHHGARGGHGHGDGHNNDGRGVGMKDIFEKPQ